MNTPRQELEERVASAVGKLVSPMPPTPYVRPCLDPLHGDFQTNVALVYGKMMKRNPVEIAQQLAEVIFVRDIAEKPEIAGPGFLNFRLKPEYLAAQVAQRLADDRLGIPSVAAPETIILDYSGPNIAKEMHVGHLRSTVLGDALARLFCFLGHKVIADNHLGDWGTGFGMILLGYKREGDPVQLQTDPFGHLEAIYKKVQSQIKAEKWSQREPTFKTFLDEGMADRLRLEAMKKEYETGPTAHLRPPPESPIYNRLPTDEEISKRAKKRAEEIEVVSFTEEAAKQELVKLQQGDAENRRLWEEFRKFSLDALDVIYQRLGVQFDYTLGESFYNEMLPRVVEDMLSRFIARESKGAVAIFSDGQSPPKEDPFLVSEGGEFRDNPLLIRKSDGGYNYATTDLATIAYRSENFKANRVVYVVDGRQQLHFRQLFAAARRWGFGHMKFEHVWFGTILGPDKKPMKTKEGDNVKLKALLDEAEARAAQILEEKLAAQQARAAEKAGGLSPDEQIAMADHQRLALARVVGLGALKYADLAQNRNLDYVFNWDKLLAFDGNTAPYVQNAFVRIRAIFRKAGIAQAPPGASVTLAEPAEIALAAKLLDFADSLALAAEEYRPHYLCQYLFELATLFHKFYESCPVLSAAVDVRASRLALCDLTARTLQQGLSLLGIGVMEQM